MRSPVAAEGFSRVFGQVPEGVWSAPGRVNLIGEFTDYNDGYVLPLALPYSARAAASRRGDGLARVASAQRTERGRPVFVEASLDNLKPGANGWTAYVLGVIWAMQKGGAELGGVDVNLDSDVPIGAGLSSSAAIECSVALALNELYGLLLSRQELASMAQLAENEFVGVPTGIMDQTASMRCRADHALFLDTRSLDVLQVPFKLERAGLTLLVVNTGVKHALGNSAYAARRRDCLRAAEELGVPALRDIAPDEMDTALAGLSDPIIRKRARHIISEQGRVLEVVRLLESGRPAEIGVVLTAGHKSLRDDFEVSCAELDTVVEVSVATGALGARMTGGGFGGSAVVLVELSTAAAVSAQVRSAFSMRGFTTPEIFPVVACGGATRVA